MIWLIVGLLFALEVAVLWALELRRPKVREGWTPVQGEAFAALSLTVAKLGIEMDSLPKKWDDIKRDARRIEERTRGRIRRAQQELEDGGDPAGIEYEGEASGTLAEDGEGAARVPRMPARMEGGPGRAPATPAPNPVDELRRLQLRKHGFG